MDNVANFQINIGGNVFAFVGKLQGDFNQFVNVINKVDNSVNQTFSTLQKRIESINIASIITQVKEVSAGIASISKPGIDFSQGMADLSSITGIVGDDLIELSKTARRVGKESGLGAAEALKSFTTIASQIDVDDIGLDGLKELQAKAVTLAHASAMPLEEATNALAGTINQFGFEAGEASRVINVLAAGSKYGAAEINDLAESFKVVGSQASIGGVSIEETAGALEILAQNNIKGSEAGTHLRNIILSLQTTFGADLKKMSLTEALDQLKPKLEDATFMSQNFGRMSMASAQFLIKNAEALGEMTEKVTGTDTALEQATVRTDTIAMMMERCRAKADDLKIGFFELTGSFGGYATIIGEQAVTIAQLLPLLTLLAKGAKAVAVGFQSGAIAMKLQVMWAGILKGVTWLLTVAQNALNAAIWANPITWIVAAIVALIATIILCITKIQGWGAQWTSVVNFMKAVGLLFIKTIKFEFQTLVNGIMLGLDYIKLGWYKFKQAVGIGDSAENESMIAKINGDIEGRKTAIADGARELADLAKQASGALTWELSWKEKDKDEKKPIGTGFLSGSTPETDEATGIGGLGSSGGTLNLNGKGGRRSGSGSGSASSSTLDLNKIIPDLKGTTSYSAIASRLGSFRTSAITAAASVALPLTVAATSLPKTSDPNLNANHTEYTVGRDRQRVSMPKFCDKLEIHIANADNKGYDQIKTEVARVIKEVFDDYGA